MRGITDLTATNLPVLSVSSGFGVCRVVFCVGCVGGGAAPLARGLIILISILVWPFRGCGAGACELCPRSRARRMYVCCLPRFVLLGSFSDTLLVVSILVYDSHL